MVVLLGGSAWAQSQGSRPIEFSEPRDKSGQATNDQKFGNDRRRLKDLEDRLSKTFNFFESSDSLGGAPAPRLPRRAPVPAKRSQNSGIFDTEEQREDTDPLARLRQLLESEGLLESSLDSEDSATSPEAEPDLLEALKSDDWLSRGMLDETFWGTPLETEDKPNEDSPWETAKDSQNEVFKPNNFNDLRPRLEGFLDQSSANQSAFATRSSGFSSFTGGNAFELGRPSRTVTDTRRDEYRNLLGMGISKSPNQTATSINTGTVSSGYTPPTASSMGVRRESQQSMYPVRGGYDRTSLYPTAPTAPKRPSVFDPIEVEVPAKNVSPSANLLANPFYEQPQRQF